MQTSHRIFIGLLIVACSLTFLSLFITSGNYLLNHNPKAMDFIAFYTGANLLLNNPNSLYNLHSQLILQQHIDPITKSTDIFLPFLNPPFVAVVFEMLVNLGLNNAYIIFLWINILLLGLICYLFLRQIKITNQYLTALFIIGIVTYIPILTTLIIGQLSILLCLIFLLAWICLKKGQEFRSGLLLSLILIKPHFFILPLLAVLIQRRSKLIYGLITGTAILAAISYLYVGWNGISNYITLLNTFYQSGTGYSIDLMAQHSLQTFLLIIFRTTSLDAIRIPWIILSVCIILPTLYIWSKRFPYTSMQTSIQFAILIIATLLTSPHTHFHDLSMLIVVAVLLIWIIKNKTKESKKLIVLLIIGYLIELVGYLLDVQTHMYTRQLWISTNVIYLLIFWFVLLRKLINNDKDTV